MLDLPPELCGPTSTLHDEDVMQYYGTVIDTLKGRCTIAFRNSSNGYYGGNLSWNEPTLGKNDHLSWKKVKE